MTSDDRLLDDDRLEMLGMLLETEAEVANAVTADLTAVTDEPIPWIGVLIRLARSPGRALRMSELARDMTISTSGLTRLIDRIETAGHVERVACPEDRRGYLATLTDLGAAELARILPTHLDSIQTRILDALDGDEATTLTDLLRKVRDHIRYGEDG